MFLLPKRDWIQTKWDAQGSPLGPCNHDLESSKILGEIFFSDLNPRSRLVLARWPLTSGRSQLLQVALAFGFISSRPRAEALVQQHAVCCCVPAPAFTPCRAGAARANKPGDFQSAWAEPYAVEQFVSDSFQQADESRDTFSALRCSLQLIEHVAAFAEGSRWTAITTGNENSGKPNKGLILHRKTPMASNCFICWKLWK